MTQTDVRARDCARRMSDLTGAGNGIPDEAGLALNINALLVGQPQQNLFGALNAALGGFTALDQRMMRGYRCTVTYAEAPDCHILKDGERIPVAADALAGILSMLDTRGAAPVECELTSDNPLLKGIRLLVLASAEDFEDVAWDSLLMRTDECYFALSATALLSMSERSALRRSILPAMAGHLNVVVLQNDLILDDDRPHVQGSIESFFEEKASIFYLPDEGTEKLRASLTGLAQNAQALAQAREVRTSVLLLQRAIKDATLQIDALSANAEHMEDAIQLLNEKAKTLPARQEAACRRARMRYTVGMKVDVSTEISGFNLKLREQVRSDIEASDKIEELQDLLPRYISDMWNRELDNARSIISSTLSNMADGLSDFVAKDIRDYIAEGSNEAVSNLALTISDLYSAPESVGQGPLNFEKAKDKSMLKTYGAIATGVALILFSNPIIGAAVAVFGARYFKKEERARFLQTNKRALLTAASELCDRAYNEAVTALDKTFASIDTELSDRVEDCYQKIMAIMIRALNDRKADLSAHSDRLEALSGLKEEMRALLNEIPA